MDRIEKELMITCLFYEQVLTKLLGSEGFSDLSLQGAKLLMSADGKRFKGNGDISKFVAKFVKDNNVV